MESDGFSTLQTDGTTKFGKHMAAYDIRVPESKTYVLGARLVFSGSSDNTLDTLKEILDDLDVVQNQLGNSAVSSIILSKIKNTMSDRHAAEKLFNRVLEDFRADVLPLVVEKWNDMTDDEKEQLERMNNFFVVSITSFIRRSFKGMGSSNGGSIDSTQSFKYAETS